MAIQMYDITIPTYTLMLGNLKSILIKAKSHADEHKFDPAALLGARLSPDMFDLKRQVQSATDQARGLARLADMEILALPKTEETIDDLVGRIDRSIEFINAIPAEKINGTENKEIELNLGSRTMKLTGLQFQQRMIQGNFYFHVTTAYAILRHNGVTIGKRDYLGGS